MKRKNYVLGLLLLISGAIQASHKTIDDSDWTEILLDGSKSVNDCRCDVSAVREANSRQIHSILNELLNTTYFRLFKIPKDGECPFNSEIVSSSEDEEVSNEVVEEDEGTCGGEMFQDNLGPLLQGGLFGDVSPFSGEESEGKSKCELEAEVLDTTITSIEDASLRAASEDMDCDDERKPSFWLNMCVKIDSDEDDNYTNVDSRDFVNLQKNIEHYTGYNGSKIWEAIYNENCFKDKVEENMCLEERVLYRLTSGLHASINTHIALNFYEDKERMKLAKDQNEVEISRRFLPDPERFVRVVGSYPERVQNLYFSFVFLLRAVKKAEPLLQDFKFSVADKEEEKKIELLIDHLLNSDVIQSCKSVFDAFDERLLFQADDLDNNSLKELKRNFKGVFHNISSYFSCVKCQRCKLHGKMQLLGIGTALKILLVPNESFGLVSLSREEIVALINTLGKFSESVESIPKLVASYWEKQSPEVLAQPSSPTGNDPSMSFSENEKFHYKRYGVRAVATALMNSPNLKHLEEKLIDGLLDEDPSLLALVEHYLVTNDHDTFLALAIKRIGEEAKNPLPPENDVVIVGSGLSGLTVALTVLDQGGKVVIVDKEKFLGGNSVKASSGINAISEEVFSSSSEIEDTYELYFKDIITSGATEPLNRDLHWESKVKHLVHGSTDALNFLRQRVGLKLEDVGQLGGHSKPRTYRPRNGLAGSEMVAKLLGEVRKFESTGRLQILHSTRVTEILVSQNGNGATGVKCKGTNGEEFDILARNVVVGTGGYAFTSAENIPLHINRPDLMNLRSTNGRFAIGDGIGLLQQYSDLVQFVDLKHVQVHPTGFLPFQPTLDALHGLEGDVADKRSGVKLCAEILRGVGALLFDIHGKRFVDELERRDFISSKMLEHYLNDSDYVFAEPIFLIVLNDKAAQQVSSHAGMYIRSGLLEKFENVEEIGTKFNFNVEMFKRHLDDYNSASQQKQPKDKFGKTVFNNVPVDDSTGPFLVGIVTPVVHYTMGGVETNIHGHVLTRESVPVENLYAVGEVVGGLHGKNRLGGNALTECVVSGRTVGKSIKIASPRSTLSKTPGINDSPVVKTKEMKIPLDQLKAHSAEDNCWVLLDDGVYDLTDFMHDHPAGKEPILRLCGTDGTTEFEEIHSYELLESYSLKPIAHID